MVVMREELRAATATFADEQAASHRELHAERARTMELEEAVTAHEWALMRARRAPEGLKVLSRPLKPPSPLTTPPQSRDAPLARPGTPQLGAALPSNSAPSSPLTWPVYPAVFPPPTQPMASASSRTASVATIIHERSPP